jgi:signal recognition particle GTPase
MPGKINRKKSSQKINKQVKKIKETTNEIVDNVDEIANRASIISGVVSDIISDTTEYIKDEVFDENFLVNLTGELMTKISERKELTKEEQPIVLHTCVKSVIENQVEDLNQRQYLLELQKSVTPSVIELGVEASRDRIGVKLKLTTSNNCFASCCGCCLPKKL